MTESMREGPAAVILNYNHRRVVIPDWEGTCAPRTLPTHHPFLDNQYHNKHMGCKQAVKIEFS